MDRVATVVLRILKTQMGEEQRIGRESLRRQVTAWLGVDQDGIALDEEGFVPDREIRLAIEYLRTNDPDGCMIAAHPRGGYFMCETIAELDGFLMQDEARAKSVWQRIQAQRKLAGLKAVQLQPTLFDVPARREDQW
jgi:hypothetical protein